MTTDEVNALIAERDSARAKADALRKAAVDAATSLNTIARLAGRKTYGNPPLDAFMDDFPSVRGYALNRSGAAVAAFDAAREVTR